MDKKLDIVSLLIGLHRGKLDRRKEELIKNRIETDPKVAELNSIIGALERSLCSGRERDEFVAARMLSRRLFDDFVQKQSMPDRGVNVYDSGLLPHPEGVRPAVIDTRRMKYRFDNFAVELCLYPVTPDSYELIGQLDGLEPGKDIRVNITADRLSAETSADEFHLFRFDRVPAARMTLTFKGGTDISGTIIIEP